MTQEPNVDSLGSWSDTWFGAPRTWSAEFTHAAEECLALDAAAALTWGPDYRLFYNRAYANLLETQHPGVRGRPAWEAVPSMWSILGPILHRVRETGQSERGERVALPRDTPEGRRLHWYSWTYTPVWCGGQVEGVFAVVHDDTAAELAERHGEALAAVRDLAASADVTTAMRELVSVLGVMPDVRFAVVHRWDGGSGWNRLAHAGPELRPRTGEALLDHAEATGRWPLPPLDPDAGSAALRTPDQRPHGLGDSWSVLVHVHDVAVALTVGFTPMVGDAAAHRRFLDEVVRHLTDGA